MTIPAYTHPAPPILSLAGLRRLLGWSPKGKTRKSTPLNVAGLEGVSPHML